MESRNFKQVTVPCKDCLVVAACEDKKRTDRQLENVFDFMLVLEKWDEKEKSYRKGLMEAWANQGFQILDSMRDSDYNGLPAHATPAFVDLLIELSSLLQWIVNSTSWQKGEKQGFDKTEIKKKLQIAMGWI